MNSIFMKKTETLLTEFWAIIHITGEFKFCKNLSKLIFQKDINIWLAQFFAIIYITSEYNFYEKTKTLLTQFWVIICTPRKLTFHEKKNRNFIDSILGNNLRN